MEPAVTALAGIWLAVVAMSVLAPDMVTGSHHEHLPLAAFTTWIWGAVASGSVVATVLRLDDGGRPHPVVGQLASFVLGGWVVAALVAIGAPEMVTGSDPTRLPIAALLAPIAATVLTTGVCATVSAFVRRGQRV
jgi:hypothetical protein